MAITDQYIMPSSSGQTQFQGGGSPSVLNLPIGSRPSDITPKSVTVANAKPAIESYNNIKSNLGVIDAGLTGQALYNATNSANAKQADPTIQAAMSGISAEELLKSNPQAAYYRAFGKQATPEQLAQFQKDQNPLVGAIDKAAGALGESTGTKEATGTQAPTVDPNSLEGQRAAITAEQDARFDKMIQDVDAMKAGTLPLTPDQLAQVDALKRQFESLKEQQKLYNQNYEGGINIAGIVSGRSRYAPEIAMGQLMAAQSAGVAKIADIDTKMNSAISQLRQGFMDSNYKMIESSYKLYNDYQKEKKDELQKQIDDAKTAEKDLREWNYNTLTKPIQDIATSALSNGAEPSVISAIMGAKSIDEAFAMAGDSLTKMTGDFANYPQYKKDTLAKGLTPELPTQWLANEQKRQSQLKANEAYASAYASAKGKAVAEGEFSSNQDINLIDPTSQSILAQTGLSQPAFDYATKGTAALARLSESARTQYMNEWRDFQVKNNIDTSTFKSQYEALNTVVERNTKIAAMTGLSANDMLLSLDNLSTIAKDQDLGKLKIGNVIKEWAGTETNDTLAAKYAFNLSDLRSALAGFFAAQQGKTSADIPDLNEASLVIKNGLSTGTIDGLKQTIKSTAERYTKIADQSVSTAKKQVWDMFGVGGNYQGDPKAEINQYIQSNPSDAETIAKLYEVPGATDAKIYQWLKSNGKIQ